MPEETAKISVPEPIGSGTIFFSKKMGELLHNRTRGIIFALYKQSKRASGTSQQSDSFLNAWGPEHWKFRQKLPHQSKLGNSSNFIEIPRQACLSMAGPTPQGVDYHHRRITKTVKSSNPVIRSFVTFLWCGSYKTGGLRLTVFFFYNTNNITIWKV